MFRWWTAVRNAGAVRVEATVVIKRPATYYAGFSRGKQPVEDPYAVLGVKKTASDAEIKLAYLKLAKSLHPDVNPGDAKSAVRFIRTVQAYQLLSNPVSRSHYDEQCATAPQRVSFVDMHKPPRDPHRQQRPHFSAAHNKPRPKIPHSVFVCIALSVLFMGGMYNQAKNNIIANARKARSLQQGLRPPMSRVDESLSEEEREEKGWTLTDQEMLVVESQEMQADETIRCN